MKWRVPWRHRHKNKAGSFGQMVTFFHIIHSNCYMFTVKPLKMSWHRSENGWPVSSELQTLPRLSVAPVFMWKEFYIAITKIFLPCRVCYFHYCLDLDVSAWMGKMSKGQTWTNPHPNKTYILIFETNYYFNTTVYSVMTFQGAYLLRRALYTVWKTDKIWHISTSPGKELDVLWSSRWCRIMPVWFMCVCERGNVGTRQVRFLRWTLRSTDW